jgi:hypothetical protein
MGHNSWIASQAARAPSATKPAVLDDFTALVEKWNAGRERRKAAQYGYAERRRYRR